VQTYRLASAIMLVAALVTGVTFATGAVAADGHDSALGDVLDGPDANESTLGWASDGLSATWAGAQGAQDRAGWWISNQVPALETETSTATEEARSVTTYYNGHNATLEEYASDRTNWTSNQTLEITWHLEDSTATRYLLANVSDGNVTSSRMVANTSRSADHTLKLCRYGAEQSQEELKYFVQEYAEDGEDVDAAYKARLKGKYNDDVETTLFPSGGECGGDA